MSDNSGITLLSLCISCILFLFTIFMLSLSNETKQKELYLFCLENNIKVESCITPSNNKD